MRTPRAKTKPRKTTLASFPVPTAGLISNRNLALPTGQAVPPGAAILENWFPTPSTIRLRRGLQRRATLPDGLPVRSLFTYVLGEQQQLFAATDTGIWNVTTVAEPYPHIISPGEGLGLGTDDGEFIGWGSVDGLDVLTGTTNGDWITLQFSTTGGTYVIGVNGVDTGFIYDGTDFWPYVDGGVSQMAVTISGAFEDGEDLTGPAKERYALTGVVGTFQVGETVTGGTSTETATVLSVGTDEILVGSASGPFTDGETITGGTSAATGDIDGAPVDETPTATVTRATSGFLYLIDMSGVFAAGDAIVGDVSGSGTIDDLPILIAPGVEGIASNRLSYVWAYKQRVWFIEKNSLNAWYLPVDQVGGEADAFPMGGVFNRGGSLLFGQNWSLDSGGEGGLSEQNVFVTTEGEVAAYQGLSPDDAQTWGKVGVYRIGKPLGKKAFIRAGGDLVIATSIGFIPLGQAIQRDYAALGTIAISNPIADEWRTAVTERGLNDWQCELWGEGSMVLVAPPTPGDMSPVVFVTNSDSAAWATFTGWHPISMEVFRGNLILGSTGGRVQNAWVGGADEGIPYTGTAMPLFNDLGAPGQRKFAEFARAVLRSAFPVIEKITARFDWSMSRPAVPNGANPPVQSVWDLGEWDSAVWNETILTTIQEQWRSIGGTGYAASVMLQVTSGATIPADVELVRLDYSYSQGDIVT